ncbi:MAG: hypothetical protein KF799_13070 [Bdellovibrionales bacterium]|nr:hypothetical protein [Bdellovibrionales bacterium]
MSARHNSSNSLPLFAILLGALSFNLSSWPTVAVSVQTTSLSSLDSCGIERQMEEGDSAGCNINDEVVSGTVNAKFEEREVRDRANKEDPMAKKLRHEWSIDICMRPTKAAIDDGAGVIATDCEPTRYAKSEVEAAKLIREITTNKKAQIAAQIEDTRKKKEEEKLKAARIDNCEIGRNGEELTDSSTLLKCKMDKLPRMKAEEAASFYDLEIQPELQKLIGCTGNNNLAGLGGLSTLSGPVGTFGKFNSTANQCKAQRAKGAELLKYLAKKSGRNVYITQSITDLTTFGAVSEEVDTLTLMAGQLQANDPRLREIKQKLATLQQQWGGHLASRGLEVSRLRNPMGWSDSFSVSSGLYGDLKGLGGYGSDMDAAFARVAQIHQEYLTTTGQSSQIVNSGAGRNLRGNSSGSYAGAPGSNVLTQTPGQNGYRGGVQQPGLQNRGMVPNSTGRPLNGSNIVKPALGQSVLQR